MREKSLFLILISALLLFFYSCQPETVTDYQAYMQATPSKSVFVLNGNSESISALDTSSGTVYNHIQIVGYSGTNRAIPADIMVSDGNINVILSGQNSIESYDKLSLDYIDAGRHYFKNGFNPMAFIPVPGKSWVFTAGFETDEVQPVNLAAPSTDYSFVKAYNSVDMPVDAHSETRVVPTTGNAVGDNKKRGSTGGVVLLNGSSSRLYITNVRYDSSILMTESDGSLAEYPESSGRNVKAAGYFREATLSIFSFNANSMQNGASDGSLGFSLVKEIDLDALFSDATGSAEYFPGNGLNPQSAYILDGLLNIICTGTNGGNPRTYTDSEYIPGGYSLDIGDEKPGTNPDDGIVLVLDISDPDNPSYIKHLNIGGSPVGFRNSVDYSRSIVYLAGVGGIQSYRYGAGAGDYSVLHSSSDMILTADNPDSDYYSGLCYDDEDNILYISFYSEDSIKTINAGTGTSSQYSEGTSYSVGDGPGSLCIIKR